MDKWMKMGEEIVHYCSGKDDPRLDYSGENKNDPLRFDFHPTKKEDKNIVCVTCGASTGIENVFALG